MLNGVEGWERIAPEAAGFDAGALDSAIGFAEAHDSDWPRSLYHPDGRYAAIAYVGESGPWSTVVGPVRARGGPAGMILQGGCLVAAWGDIARTDMTFSVAKSYLAVLAGVAVGDGLIRELDEPVARRVEGPWFAGPHNGAITWRHLLHQTSEWEGELWGKPDTVDRNREVGARFDNSRKGEARALEAPGSRFEYNDVRVNLLALALLQVFRRALPEILRERVMHRIGASPDWSWHGYDSSWTEIDGQSVQSVPGGGHWGGGLFIGASDHARLGLLVLRDGVWNGRRILPAGWVGQMLAPSPRNPEYGFLWWLNGGPAPRYPSAPAGSVFALGGGAHAIWIERAWDMVAVIRWIERKSLDGFMARVAASRTTG